MRGHFRGCRRGSACSSRAIRSGPACSITSAHVRFVASTATGICRRPRDRHRMRAVSRRAGVSDGIRKAATPAEDLPELRHAPEGIAAARHANGEKFHRPVIVPVDMPAAYPRNPKSAAPRKCRLEPARDTPDTPIVVVVTGEGGAAARLSGDRDRVMMQEYHGSVIPRKAAPRSCGATQSARSKRPSVEDHCARPAGARGHRRSFRAGRRRASGYQQAATILGDVIERDLALLNAMTSAARLEARYQKFRQMGDVGLAASPAFLMLRRSGRPDERRRTRRLKSAW